MEWKNQKLPAVVFRFGGNLCFSVVPFLLLLFGQNGVTVAVAEQATTTAIIKNNLLPCKIKPKTQTPDRHQTPTSSQIATDSDAMRCDAPLKFNNQNTFIIIIKRTNLISP